MIKRLTLKRLQTILTIIMGNEMLYVYPKTKPYISVTVGVDAYIKSTSLITDNKLPSVKQMRRQQYIDSLDKKRGKK